MPRPGMPRGCTYSASPKLANAPLSRRSIDGTMSSPRNGLLGGTVPIDLTMPEGNLPVQITFPYYQEKRVHITLHAGYKVANKAAFQADISDNGAQPALGLKVRCEQDGNQLNIFVLEWYRQTDFTGNNKQLFSQLVHKVRALQQQHLVLAKE